MEFSEREGTEEGLSSKESYRILNKIKTIKKSRGRDEHILLSYIPSHTNPPTRSKAPMSLKCVIEIFIDESFGIKAQGLGVFFFV
jgi:hypothetical protein